MTPKQFLLKKYPPKKWDDCPVPKEYWDDMQEYAEKCHEDKIKRLLPASKEMVSFLLVNALRSLSEAQMADLCFSLYVKSGQSDVIDKRIEELKKK